MATKKPLRPHRTGTRPMGKQHPARLPSVLIKIGAIGTVLLVVAFLALRPAPTAQPVSSDNREEGTQNVLVDDRQVLERLGDILHLPQDADPTMAIITDVNVLKASQPGFFADAKNGDRLIIYPEMAIIYDFEAHKIIRVGPVQAGETVADASDADVLDADTSGGNVMEAQAGQ